VVAEISNLASEIKFFDLLTYIFATRAFELKLLRASSARNSEEVRVVLSVTRHIDYTILNTIRQLYPFLFSLETKEGIHAGERVLKLISWIENVQAYLDRLILDEMANGRLDEVYEELLKRLIRRMLVSNEKTRKLENYEL